eukprot:Nitzschia sp. Nitz4//scaffold242_size29646//22986//25981//NITZ4_008053-RA/size29646-processed-gene-0.14-mRNA-1//1//CDS//3329543821//3885//frame0
MSENENQQKTETMEVQDSQEKLERTETKMTTSEEDSEQKTSSNTCANAWAAFIGKLHAPIVAMLVHMSRYAATNPKRTLATIVPMSLLIVVLGMVTNFNIDVNEDTLWSPIGSYPVAHMNWINDQSGFPAYPRYFQLTVHADGQDVVSIEGVNRMFTVLDTLMDTPGYDELCLAGTVPLPDGTMTCTISSPSAFWNHSLEIFQEQVQEEQDINIAFSSEFYPDGAPVDLPGVLGHVTYDSDGIVESAPIYIMRFDLPREDDETDAEDFEEVVLDKLGRIRQAWENESGNPFRLEYFADRSFSDEFERAIVKDIPLVPVVFIIMSIFTSMVFFKRDLVQSRTVVGFGAVCSVLLAIMTGYGLLFIFGVPFTSMTQILPFIMFGVGLDGAFILTGSFFRTHHNRSAIDRIEETVRDVGMSISVTTLTSATAFALGCMSSVPAVRWLCLYAFPTILVSFVYQFTFFVAIMVLDERRVADNRRDWLCCMQGPKVEEASGDADEKDDADTENPHEGSTGAEEEEEVHVSTVDKFMMAYADKLLHNTPAKIFIIGAFLGLLVSCAISASQLKQKFDYREVLPDDSYVSPFFDSLEDHSARGGAVVDVYFRDVDQSSPEIQQQMEDYVNDLIGLEQIPNQPAFFWLRDFNEFTQTISNSSEMPFHELFQEFYNDPIYNNIYGEDFVLDDEGNIEASRTRIYMNGVDFEVVTIQIEALEDQRAVTKAQPVNQGSSEWAFFSFSDTYLIWEFYSVAVDELILNTILGVVSVTVIGTLFMPHWSAFFFVGPLICVLYVDLLGVLQWAGISVNPVSYVSLVMSIGLLVDFIVHILLRYYEVEGDRFERTKELLRTMGSSVMLGGISTFLGVLPLAFSTSSAFFTIFVAFMALVSLGITHGLILLPVLLSMFGPENAVVLHHEASNMK